MTPNRLLFSCAQVNRKYVSTIRSNRLCLLVVPCPHTLMLLMKECLCVVRALLMLSGDVESNPGPPETLEDKVGKLLHHQEASSKILNDIKRDQRAMQKTLSDSTKSFQELDARLVKIESSLRVHAETIAVVEQLQKTVAGLTKKIDDLENRSRRNNLIAYGLKEEDRETNDNLAK